MLCHFGTVVALLVDQSQNWKRSLESLRLSFLYPLAVAVRPHSAAVIHVFLLISDGQWQFWRPLVCLVLDQLVERSGEIINYL